MTAPAEEKETGRIEAFSDGVFAIAITLLVLELKVPHVEEGGPRSLAAALAAEWPSYLAFVSSFFTILIMWANHHAIFKMVRRMNAQFLFANGFLLLLVTVVPFPTAVLAQYLTTPAAPVAAAVYAGTFVVGAVAYNFLWSSALSGRLLRPDVSEEAIRDFTKRYRLGLPMYLLATAAAFVSVAVSVGICIALWFFWIFTARRI